MLICITRNVRITRSLSAVPKTVSAVYNGKKMCSINLFSHFQEIKWMNNNLKSFLFSSKWKNKVYVFQFISLKYCSNKYRNGPSIIGWKIMEVKINISFHLYIYCYSVSTFYSIYSIDVIECRLSSVLVLAYFHCTKSILPDDVLRVRI